MINTVLFKLVLNLFFFFQIISELADDSELLIDTVGYLYYPVSFDDVNTTITCVVNHPQTSTTLTKSEQLSEF